MRLVCPSCGAMHSAEAWESDALMRQFAAIMAELPQPVSRLALPYLALFRPTGARGLQWAKALRLIAELRLLVIEAQIQWDRKPARPNSAQAWGMALEQIIQHPPKRLPLTSHGYLNSVAYERANELDRGREVRRNAAERSGHAVRSPRAEGSVMSPEEAPPNITPERYEPPPEVFERLRAAVRGVGKKI